VRALASSSRRLSKSGFARRPIQQHSRAWLSCLFRFYRDLQGLHWNRLRISARSCWTFHAESCANIFTASGSRLRRSPSPWRGLSTHTCQGPTNSTYGPENYPAKCGNPNATCATGTPNCTNGVSAYFYPMFDPPENAYQPNAVCIKGSLSISFLSGS
jgi:hypothetical protein